MGDVTLVDPVRIPAVRLSHWIAVGGAGGGSVATFRHGRESPTCFQNSASGVGIGPLLAPRVGLAPFGERLLLLVERLARNVAE